MSAIRCVSSSIIFLFADRLISDPKFFDDSFCVVCGNFSLSQCSRKIFGLFQESGNNFCERWHRWRDVENDTAFALVFLLLAMCVSGIFLSSAIRFNFLLTEAHKFWLKFLALLYFLPVFALCTSKTLRVNFFLLLLAIGVPWILLTGFLVIYGYCSAVARALGIWHGNNNDETTLELLNSGFVKPLRRSFRVFWYLKIAIAISSSPTRSVSDVLLKIATSAVENQLSLFASAESVGTVGTWLFAFLAPSWHTWGLPCATLWIVAVFRTSISYTNSACGQEMESAGLFALSMLTALFVAEDFFPNPERLGNGFLPPTESRVKKAVLFLGHLASFILPFLSLEFLPSESVWLSRIGELCVAALFSNFLLNLLTVYSFDNDWFYPLTLFYPTVCVFKMFVYCIALVTVILRLIFVTGFNPYDCLTVVMFLDCVIHWGSYFSHETVLDAGLRQRTQGSESQSSDPKLLEQFSIPTELELNEYDDICGICRDSLEMRQDIRITPCAHIFHGHCIRMALEISGRSVCPLCRMYFFVY